MKEASVVAQLSGLLGPEAALGPDVDLARYTRDWRDRHGGPAACVVLPSCTADVAKVVRWCVEHKVPILPQGGNTSLCAGATPRAAGDAPVVVALERMRTIRSLDVLGNTITVDAGCVLADVQLAAAKAGRLYPVSLGAEGSCQIGGTIATNAGGTAVLRYGNTRENVLGLEVVLPGGDVWNGLRSLRKDNTGLDLKQLFIGAEGTMGIVTAACLRLHPLPTRHATAWCAPASPVAALRLLDLFRQRCGSTLSAFEMLDANQVRGVLRDIPGRRLPLGDEHGWHLLVELADCGDESAGAGTMEALLGEAIETRLVEAAVVASSGAQRAAMWEFRHSISEANKRGGMGLTTDCAVPVSLVPEFIERATDAVRRVVPGIEVRIISHLGDGNVHFVPFLGFAQWEALPDRDATARALRRAANDVAHELGGTFSAEHGIGETMLPEMANYKSALELAMMRVVKNAFDPLGLFNPGRLFP